MKKLIAELNSSGVGHISIPHKAQGMEFEARVFSGLLGDNPIFKERARKLLQECQELDFICINGEIIKGKNEV